MNQAATFERLEHPFLLRWNPGENGPSDAKLEEGLESFHDAVGPIASGALDVGHLLEPRYALEEVQLAMDVAHERRALRVSFDLT